MLIRKVSSAVLCGAGLAILLMACSRTSEAEQASTAIDTTPVAMAPGEQSYTRKCGFCHIGRGTGTIMLERRIGKGQGELAKRTDLDRDYVINVARNGLMSMPAFSHVDVSDQELGKIADYLTRNTKPADAEPKEGGQ